MNESKRPWQRLHNILKSKNGLKYEIVLFNVISNHPQNALLLPHFHLSHCSHDETYNKSFHFLVFSVKKKKVEVRVPSYKTKQKTLFMKIASDKFSLHVSLHVCTNFKMKTKISAPLKITF